ncbi:PDZ domain-containing protein [Trichonephila inaurata madagascariensis]|uniref:PDZ domain-containing protein n=1 Tax=Trichonephila inaurata madagascariensis TaxID=2747483 RepID=A0A8X6Y2P9_9ARAC|nr:PDZ domain-containing protein [Trichonephila inaurata madagascariensis]
MSQKVIPVLRVKASPHAKSVISRDCWHTRLFLLLYLLTHLQGKVIDDSLAEKSGLREGDEIIQVGRVNVQDLNLGQVHELLARCGNKIEMFIVRSSDYPSLGKQSLECN